MPRQKALKPMSQVRITPPYQLGLGAYWA
jgi:hypothetical protein